MDHEKFCESFFIQPDLFLRIRPGYENIVKRKLHDAGFDFSEINSLCLSLPNNSKVENAIELDKEAVVQDYSSQQTADFFKLASDSYRDANGKLPVTAWDCCAGSGGKSLLLYDNYPDIDLTVSDIRESILANLKKRFTKAGIKRYKSLAIDLTNNRQPVTGNFNLIICDAPCTGSGTWSRTPEQLYFFNEKKIDQYADLQKRIVGNVVSHLKINGFLVYITCSVFKKENEEVVKYLQKTFQLKLIRKELLKGYDQKADTMFAALLKKEL
jgi:16S rRNA (cytosine967-C5)-methyltransferase